MSSRAMENSKYKNAKREKWNKMEMVVVQVAVSGVDAFHSISKSFRQASCCSSSHNTEQPWPYIVIVSNNLLCVDMNERGRDSECQLI